MSYKHMEPDYEFNRVQHEYALILPAGSPHRIYQGPGVAGSRGGWVHGWLEKTMNILCNS